MEFDEIDEMPERYEDDLEEFEHNELARDRAHEDLDDETPLGRAIDEGGEETDE